MFFQTSEVSLRFCENNEEVQFFQFSFTFFVGSCRIFFKLLGKKHCTMCIIYGISVSIAMHVMKKKFSLNIGRDHEKMVEKSLHCRNINRKVIWMLFFFFL